MRPSPVGHTARTIASLLLLLLFGCTDDSAPSIACEQICDEFMDELMDECSYPSFPNRESCLRNCGYIESQGADTGAYLNCITEADCESLAIVECENQFGPNSDD